MTNQNVTSLEQSLKSKEEGLRHAKERLQVMQDDYEEVSRKSQRFLREVSEMMMGSEDSFYFQDLADQDQETSRKVHRYFQEAEEELKQSMKRLEGEKENLASLKQKQEEDSYGR